MEDLKRTEVFTEHYHISDFKRVPRKTKKRTKLMVPPAPLLKNGRDTMLHYFGFSAQNLL
jgi:hypothetical protein